MLYTLFQYTTAAQVTCYMLPVDDNAAINSFLAQTTGSGLAPNTYRKLLTISCSPHSIYNHCVLDGVYVGWCDWLVHGPHRRVLIDMHLELLGSQVEDGRFSWLVKRMDDMYKSLERVIASMNGYGDYSDHRLHRSDVDGIKRVFARAAELEHNS